MLLIKGSRLKAKNSPEGKQTPEVLTGAFAEQSGEVSAISGWN